MWLTAVKSAVSYIFYGSVKTGQLIVTILHLVLTNSVDFLRKFASFLSVIVEDFTIFLRDISSKLHNVLSFVWYLSDLVCGLVQNVGLLCQGALNLTWMGYNGTVNVLLSLASSIRNIFVNVKRIVLMFGDGVWFIVVFIPQSIISAGLYLLLCVKSAFVWLFDSVLASGEFLLDSALDCYHFLTDVPLESCIGLVIAACFAYIFLQFYHILYANLLHTARKCSRQVATKYGLAKSALGRRKVKKVEETKCEETNFCIICQDSVKCILLLPCKHLCLCTDCTKRLMRHTGQCPICRKRVTSTMKVFT